MGKKRESLNATMRAHAWSGLSRGEIGFGAGIMERLRVQTTYAQKGETSFQPCIGISQSTRTVILGRRISFQPQRFLGVNAWFAVF